MHVSKKIAFRLDDVFYKALLQSEVVALESDPSTWLEHDTNNNSQGYGFTAKGFYTTAFTSQSPGKKDLAAFLATDDDLVNNILYRSSDYAQDFEEETYLDMFIYQAGSKFGKTILALEDLEESQALVGRASMNAMKRKPDEWLQEKMEQHDLMSLMQDAYRERNINLLDSIDRAMYTDHYLKNMLYIRNRNMASRLDSAIRGAQVFAGIGAAHLPGEKGVIALLEKQGYTVRPLVSEATAYGNSLKEKFMDSFRKPALEVQQPEDGFFSVRLPQKLYPVAEGQHTTYISPDLTNGSYFMVHRLPTYSYLNPEADYPLEQLESLLFENIPGKILNKNRIHHNGFEGLDIKNLLKNGDYQRYQIYITPLEILIFKMGGQGTYVQQFSDAVFESLKLKPLRSNIVPIRSAFDEFVVDFPAYHSYHNMERKGNRRLEGFDPQTNSYYFLKEAALNDFEFIEKDSFELRIIQDRFYRHFELNPDLESADAHTRESSAAFGDADLRLHLKTQISGNRYYLLGILTNQQQKARAYFDSFRLGESKYPEAFTQIKDSALYFSTVSPVAPNKFVETNIGHYKSRKQLKAYHPYIKKSVYQHANNEAIMVTLNKSHDYMTFRAIDSVWALRKKQYAGNSFKITNERQSRNEGSTYELNLVLTDTASTRAILVKNVIKGGLLYELKANLDTLAQPSRFVSEFFDNFKPQDTLIGRDLMEDKTTEFFAALRENDSIVMKGYRYLLFDERHADSLMHFVANYDFSGDKEHIQSHLLKELGQLDQPAVTKFLESFYARSYNNSNAQTKILQATTRQKDASSVRSFLELLHNDLPLAGNPFEIERIFAPYNDSLPLARSLFPDLLEYSTIPEYKSPIISLLATLVSTEEIKPKRYKNYVRAMLNDANMQLKRQLGFENQSRLQSGKFNKNNREHRKLLEDYTVILFPYREEREAASFFHRLREVKDPEVQTTRIALLAGQGLSIPNDMIAGFAKDINSRGQLYSKLSEAGATSLFPSEFATREFLAEAELFEGNKFDPQADTVQFIQSEDIVTEGREYTAYYFKLKDELDFNKNYKVYLLVYDKDEPLGVKACYKSKGIRMADTDTDEEIIRYATEEFQLKNHPRSEVFEKEEKVGYALY
jgi:hypothetical protein